MSGGRKILVSFSDDIPINRRYPIQVSSNCSLFQNKAKESKHEEASDALNNTIFKRYNINTDQFSTNYTDKISQSDNSQKDEEYIIDTEGGKLEYVKDTSDGRIDIELSIIDDFQDTDRLLADTISNIKYQRELAESANSTTSKYLNGANELIANYEAGINKNREKLTFFLYAGECLVDIVDLMDSVNPELSMLNQMRKKLFSSLKSVNEKDLASGFKNYIYSVADMKNKIADRYLNLESCQILLKIADRYPNDYVCSGINVQILSVLMFYTQLEMLLWDPLHIFEKFYGIGLDFDDHDVKRHIIAYSDITQFVWYRITSKFNTAETFLKVIKRNVCLDWVSDLFKVWEYLDFENTDKIVDILRLLVDISEIAEVVVKSVNRLSSIPDPRVMSNLQLIRVLINDKQ